MDWDNPLEKNPIQKTEKTVKIKVKLPHVNKKTTSEKAIFRSNTVFSLYFKFRAKKFHAAKPLVVSLHFLFRCDQNLYSNFTSKIMKMCEQINKKRAPQYNSNSLNCKNQEHRNIAPISLQLRSYKNKPPHAIYSKLIGSKSRFQLIVTSFVEKKP